jgi:hypothetical protein
LAFALHASEANRIFGVDAMLRHAGEYALELFESQLREPSISVPAITKSEAVEVVRRRREEWNQDLAFGARTVQKLTCGE